MTAGHLPAGVVVAVFTAPLHRSDGLVRLAPAVMIDPTPIPPYLADRGQVAAAAELIARFGLGAGAEAAQRAGRSRIVGNHIHFCRWRQIERLIAWLASGRAVGTVH